MTGLLHEREFSRATFVKQGGALIVGFSIAGSLAAGASAGLTPVPAGVNLAQVDSWLSVGSDNNVTLYTGKVEITGSPTGLLQIAAEELNLPMSQIKHSLPDTFTAPNQGATWGSDSISSGGPQVRAAAAAAYQSLVSLASTQLGVPASGLTVANGIVSGGGKSVTFGQLVGGKLFNITLPLAAQSGFAAGAPGTKPVSEYTLVTTSVPRVDIPAKVTGTYTYVQNLRVPGMLHGRVVRPRGQTMYGWHVPIVSVDESSISNIPGAQVVQIGNFLGVVAPLEYDAIQAASLLKVTWAAPPDTLPGDGDLFKAMPTAPQVAPVTVNASVGNTATALASAAHTVAGTFAIPYNMHGTLGPVCSVADVSSTGAVVYLPSQNIFAAQTELASVLKLPASAIRVYYYEGAGCYGGNQQNDVGVAAAAMSQQVGKPVRVQFMRWDDSGWDNYAPPFLMDVVGGVDSTGHLTAYTMNAWTHGWNNFGDPTQPGFDTSGELLGFPQANPQVAGYMSDSASNGTKYTIPNRSSNTVSIVHYLRAAWMRAPGESQPLFASEQILDDLARLSNMDPIAFRTLNTPDPRWVGVLNGVASLAGWETHVPGSQVASGTIVSGRGVAMGGFAGSYAAVIADVTVNKKTGKVSVTHIYGAQDAGLTINPGEVQNQMIGGMMQQVSRTLVEEVAFTKTQSLAVDWVTYPILRMADAPLAAATVVQNVTEPSTGSGEPPSAPMPAAIANAFFDATGVRVRQLPLTPARVRATLAAAG